MSILVAKNSRAKFDKSMMTKSTDQWKPYAVSEKDAQIASWVSFLPDALSDAERKLFPFLQQSNTTNMYLSGRNFLLKEWHLKYSNSLMTFSAVASLKINVNYSLYLNCSSNNSLLEAPGNAGCVSFAKGIPVLGSIQIC